MPPNPPKTLADGVHPSRFRLENPESISRRDTSIPILKISSHKPARSMEP